MVLYVTKWNIAAGKAEEYPAWAQRTIPRILARPGLVEFRGYRPASGAHAIVVTYEFADMASWAAWYGDETIQEIFAEARAGYITDFEAEIWGPSPVLPQPIRPGG